MRVVSELKLQDIGCNMGKDDKTLLQSGNQAHNEASERKGLRLTLKIYARTLPRSGL